MKSQRTRRAFYPAPVSRTPPLSGTTPTRTRKPTGLDVAVQDAVGVALRQRVHHRAHVGCHLHGGRGGGASARRCVCGVGVGGGGASNVRAPPSSERLCTCGYPPPHPTPRTTQRLQHTHAREYALAHPLMRAFFSV